MSFLLLLLCGFLGGVLGGMGLGGGTALVPLLTLLNVDQRVAQGLNLFSFLPMALFALSVHKKNGLLETKDLPALFFSALPCSALGALFAASLPSPVLKSLFGALLIVLSLLRLRALKNSKNVNL